MPNQEKTPRRTIRIDAELWNAAITAAARRGETLTSAIREFLTEYIKPRKGE